MKLCPNCLDTHNNGATTSIQCGHWSGDYRNPGGPRYKKYSFCLECKKAIEAGDFAALNSRYSDTRTISR